MDQQTLLEGARAIYESSNAEYELSQHRVQYSHHVDRNSTQDLYTINIAGFKLRLGGDNDRYDEDTQQFLHVNRWGLPLPLPFEAAFVKEDFTKKLAKIFKNEPQVGDPIFDDNVYITTSDPEKCLMTLTDRCQGAILMFVQQGGEVYFSEREVVITYYADGVNSVVNSSELEEQHVLIAHALQWLNA